jgi:pyruvate/2-oxoacid:ferredoxin oxidoreductase beta subunit
MFLKTIERSLEVEGTAVIFIPAPGISGWKFEDGQTVELALLGARSGVFPAFVWERGKGGSVKDCEPNAADRPSIEEFLAEQRRFGHLVRKDKDTGKPKIVAGQEENIEKLKTWVQSNVERMYGLAGLKS